MKSNKLTPPVKRNDYYETTCVAISHEGIGICKIDNYPIFVPGLLPGEQAQIKVIKVKGRMAFGRLIEIYEQSPQRVEPPCPIYQQCGGCQVQHVSQLGQKQMKQERVQQAFERIGGFENLAVHGVQAMDEPWYYRNKAQVPLGKDENGKIVAGFYRRHTHEIIPMTNCLIQNQANNTLLTRVVELLNDYNCSIYDETAHTGNIRHLLVRHGYHTNEQMLVFITREAKMRHIEQISEKLQAEFPQLVSVMHNVNPNKTNVILGQETKLVAGRAYIEDYIGDVKFNISAQSFFQVNPVQMEVLYQQAADLAGLTGQETVLDVYCGIGTIGLFLAKQVKHVYGVEIVPQAIKDAKANAIRNNITNATFVCEDASTMMHQWHESGMQADVVVLDPPRKGCDEQLLQSLVELAPEKIVYIACDVATQARDAKYLVANGYTLQEVYPVDMFGQTYHIESVVLMTKK
ncbi:MAG: 23S rRNA (uracil(1939)-C(5))-methyltransferase RlmD [Culicoidibacterales bacterium]